MIDNDQAVVFMLGSIYNVHPREMFRLLHIVDQNVYLLHRLLWMHRKHHWFSMPGTKEQFTEMVLTKRPRIFNLSNQVYVSKK